MPYPPIANAAPLEGPRPSQPMPRVLKILCILMLAICAVSFGLIALFVGIVVTALNAPPPPPPTAREVVERDCAPILEWLCERRAADGRYPGKLTPEHEQVLKSFQPHGKYELLDDGGRFILSHGDYAEDGFSFFWDSENQSWYMDT